VYRYESDRIKYDSDKYGLAVAVGVIAVPLLLITLTGGCRDYKQEALDRGLASYVLNPKTGDIEYEWKVVDPKCWEPGTSCSLAAY
jgi:hypothetical protein